MLRDVAALVVVVYGRRMFLLVLLATMLFALCSLWPKFFGIWGEEVEAALAVDNGGRYMAGFDADFASHAVFPLSVGRPAMPGSMVFAVFRKWPCLSSASAVVCSLLVLLVTAESTRIVCAWPGQ